MPEGETEEMGEHAAQHRQGMGRRARERGVPATDFLRAYMEGLRARGETPVRDWDK